jgi:fatty-acyl-CoA synthase
MNYRLTPGDFVYMVNHSGSTVLCAHADYLEALDGVRDQLPGVRHFVALEGAREGWLDYEALIEAAEPRFARPEIGERDLLTINYTSGTTSRPKGVMVTHRNAAMNVIGTLLHLPMGIGARGIRRESMESRRRRPCGVCSAICSPRGGRRPWSGTPGIGGCRC